MTAARPGPVVVGAGLAGLACALGLAERGVACTVLAPDTPGEGTSSELAQGGLAAAVGASDDPALHAADTLAAGAGLTDPEVAARITAAAPGVVARLESLGARLDRDASGALDLGLEGAHGRHRIVHAGGDGSGAELVRALVAAVAGHPLVTVRTGVRAARVLTAATTASPADSRIVGLLSLAADGSALTLASSAVVLATGGAGALFAHTTNPAGSWGSGLALGLRAGARARDLELVQFHPTALAAGEEVVGARMPLVSEAVRGEGVPLVLADGSPATTHPLAARDIVARAVWAHVSAGRTVYLDTPRLGEAFPRHFPGITAACRAAGIDPVGGPVPVRPAAHYHMGGLVTDERGRTDVPGLWAVGEVASTGLHGANRLASNSLLEALVCGDDAAADVARTAPAPPAATPARCAAAEAVFGGALDAIAGPAAADRLLLEGAAGLERDGAVLRESLAVLRAGAEGDDARLVAAALLVAALARTESRGAHVRRDHPAQAAPRHTLVTLADVLDAAGTTEAIWATRSGAGTRGRPSARRRQGAILAREPALALPERSAS